MRSKTLKANGAPSHFVTLKAGDCLFKAGDNAESMFFVTEGTVSVVNELGNVREIAILEKGQIFGERAYISRGGYLRKFSVYAKTNATLLEITRENMEVVEKLIPDLSSRIILTLLERLGRAERMIHVLEPIDAKKRIVYAILTFKTPNDELCEVAPNGTLKPMTIEQVQDLTSLDGKLVIETFEALVKKNILEKKNNRFFLTSEKELRQYAGV